MSRSRPRRIPSVPRWILLATLALFLYAVAGFLVAPYFARPYLTRTLSELLHRDVSLQRLRTNPFTLSATADRFLVKDPDGSPFVSWDRLYVNFQLVSLVTEAWTFRQIRLTNFAGHLAMRKDGSLNVSDIIDALSQEPATPQPPRPLPCSGWDACASRTPGWSSWIAPARRSSAPRSARCASICRDFGSQRDNKNPYAFAGKTESARPSRGRGISISTPSAPKGSSPSATSSSASTTPTTATASPST